MSVEYPKVVDDDKFTIWCEFKGKKTRWWHYDNDDERRRYMMYAREYVEGWYDGRKDAENAG